MFWTVCIFYVNTQQTLLNIASFFKFTLFFNDSSMTSLSMRQADLVLARTTHIGSGHLVLIRYAVQPMLNTALALAPEAAHTLTVGTQQTST